MTNPSREAELLEKIAALEKQLKQARKANEAVEKRVVTTHKKLENAEHRIKGNEQLIASLRKDKELLSKDKEVLKKDKGDLKKKVADLMAQIVAIIKTTKATLPFLEKFGKNLASRMSDDPTWNKTIVDEFIRAVAQLDAVRRDCSVLRHRVNRGGEKIPTIDVNKEERATLGVIATEMSKLVASGKYQVKNGIVVNGVTVEAIKEAAKAEVKTAALEVMQQIASQSLSKDATIHYAEKAIKPLSLGRQIPEREEIPEKTYQAAEIPKDLACPICGGGKFHVIHQESSAKMIGNIEELLKLFKVNLLKSTYAECAHCATVLPVFNPDAPMALNPKREITIETLTACADMVGNGVPLNRIEEIFFKDLKTGSSTFNDNIRLMAQYAEPLFKGIEKEAGKAPVILADETPFDVLQAEGRGHIKTESESNDIAQTDDVQSETCSQSYIEAVTSASNVDKPFALFYPMRGRSAKRIGEVLGRFSPKVIMTDGYAAYENIVENTLTDSRHATCLVHWRRELYKAAGLDMQRNFVTQCSTKKSIANYCEKIKNDEPIPILNIVLMALSKAFAEEQSVKRQETDTYEQYLAKVKKHREEYIRPYMDWIDELMLILKEKAGLKPNKAGKYQESKDSPVFYAAAVVYYLNRRDQLRYFLTDPSCPMSSNSVETRIRPLTIIRNNSNFLQSMEHAQGLCCLLSLLQTAKLNGIKDPAKWLKVYYYRLAQHCQREQWIDWTRPESPIKKNPYKKFVSWNYEKYWGSMPIEDLLPWNYKEPLEK